MPKLNPVNGKSAMGKLSLASVDGVIPAPWASTAALGPSWLDATTDLLIVEQSGTLQTLDLDTSVTATVSLVGTSDMSAGANVYAAFTFTGGVRTNVVGMGPFTQAGLCEVSATGQVAIVTNINEGGITVYNNLGTRLYGTSAKVAGNYPQRLRSNLLSWVPTDAIGWQIIDITTSTQISWQRRTEGVFALIPVTLASGAVYVLEMTEEGSNQVIWLRAATKSDAYRVYTGPAHWPDVIELTPGVVRLAWSVTAGEGVTALRVADITLATSGFSLGTTASGALSFSTQPTLTASPVATTPYGGAEGLMALFVAKHPFTDPRGVLTTPFGEPWVRRVSEGLGRPIDLSNNVSGVLQPANGGTGTTTGLTDLDGSWITHGIIPPGPLANVPNVGYWTLLSAGAPLNLEHMVAQAGSWSPLMSGPDAATSELVLDINGDCIPIWIASGTQTILPPLVDDGSGAPIAVFVPVTDEAFT